MKKLTLLMCCLLISGAAVAQDKIVDKKIDAAMKDAPVVTSSEEPGEEPDPTTFPILEKIKSKGKNLTYDYLGSRFGVDAWLLTGPAVMQIIYTTPDKKTAMVGGALLGEDGKEISSDLTKEFMTRYPKRAQEIMVTVQNQKAGAVKPNGTSVASAKNSPSQILWERLEKAGKITFGTEKNVPEIYVILDPVQQQTKDVWAKLGPLAKENKITLHILPLGLTTADSIMEIASVLGNDDPKAAWEQIVAGKSVVGETPAESGILGMQANVKLAESLSLRDVPFFVYRGADTKIRILRGMPKDWTKFTSDLSVK